MEEQEPREEEQLPLSEQKEGRNTLAYLIKRKLWREAAYYAKHRPQCLFGKGQYCLNGYKFESFPLFFICQLVKNDEETHKELYKLARLMIQYSRRVPQNGSILALQLTCFEFAALDILCRCSANPQMLQILLESSPPGLPLSTQLGSGNALHTLV